jgi:hypothetical protein
MKTNNGSQLPGRGHQRIAPVLVLAMLLSPLAYAAAQGSSNHAPSKSSDLAAQPNQPGQAEKPQSAPLDNAPVPPMPPLDPAEAAPPSSDLLPDSPGAVESAQLETQQAPVEQHSAQAQNSQPPDQQPLPPMPAATPKEPLGTAAAETVAPVGVAASRPAGAALAPAKQRRVRTILIRMGAIVGAAAALGVTMALTEGSPSKPPGAH